jgi:hypothetical protein
MIIISGCIILLCILLMVSNDDEYQLNIENNNITILLCIVIAMILRYNISPLVIVVPAIIALLYTTNVCSNRNMPFLMSFCMRYKQRLYEKYNINNI